MGPLQLLLHSARGAAVVLLGATGALSLGCGRAPDGGTTTAHVRDTNTPRANEALILRFVAASNARDWAALDSMVAPDYRHHTSVSAPALDWADWKRGSQELFDAFPDWELIVEDLVVQGDRAAMRGIAGGTHRRAFAGVPATGRMINARGTVFFRIADGRIAADWEIFDTGDLMRQLEPTPGR
jgi:steroid delta-isomerase-like uncharacterized protein